MSNNIPFRGADYSQPVSSGKSKVYFSGKVATNTENAGGAPMTFGPPGFVNGERRGVKFYGSDVIDGIVQTNDEIYFSDTAPDGWYVAPAIGYSGTKYEVLGDDYGINGFSLAGLVGHQWVFGDGGGFTIDINTGIGYNNWNVDGDAVLTRGDGVGIKGNLSFGWAF